MAENIIIDGVDVSGCKHYKNRNCIADYCLTDMPFSEAKCELNSNCYYKQLKRKEQSEERLVKQIQTICDFINNRPEIFKGIYGDVDKIITEYAERKEQECEKLKKQLFSFMNGDYCKNGCSLKQQLDKLKQTLTEIKEIAENMNEECFYDDFDCMNCDMQNGCTYFSKNQILQKIREAIKDEN